MLLLRFSYERLLVILNWDIGCLTQSCKVHQLVTLPAQQWFIPSSSLHKQKKIADICGEFTICPALCSVFAHLISAATLWDRCYYYPHVTDEKTEFSASASPHWSSAADRESKPRQTDFWALSAKLRDVPEMAASSFCLLPSILRDQVVPTLLLSLHKETSVCDCVFQPLLSPLSWPLLQFLHLF